MNASNCQTVDRCPASPAKTRVGAAYPKRLHVVCRAGWLLALWMAARPPVVMAQEVAADGNGAGGVPALDGQVIVELVADFETATPVSQFERFYSVTEPAPAFDGRGSEQIVTLGDEAVMWVRNAHVSGRFFFERYYQGKYIGREARLAIDAAELGVGPHTIEPGAHRFELRADGTLHSDDPEIRIEDRTVRLRLHRVTVYAVDGQKAGPAAFRKVPAEIGVFALAPTARIDPASLPDIGKTFDPQADAAIPPEQRAPIVNLLSHQKRFYPLHLWLPSNREGQGYVLYPSWQAFHVTPEGTIELSAGGAPPVPGVTAVGSELIVPYRLFSGRIATRTRLAAGVGAEPLSESMRIGATLAPLRFRAGTEEPAEDFFLPVDNDFSKLPHKTFVADNTTDQPSAVRLMALELDQPVFERGREAEVSLRLLESDGARPMEAPSASVEFSPYRASLPTWRDWRPVETLGWRNDRARGSLRFRVPDIGVAFGIFRVRIEDAASINTIERLMTNLWCELPAALIDPGQTGSASFAANRGRNAFAAGETIGVTLFLRSIAPREPGVRAVVLTWPDGAEKTTEIDDSGAPWAAFDLELSRAKASDLMPGSYRLSARGLPSNMASHDFVFDVVARDPRSLYLVVKPSKYTESMNELEVSHVLGAPIDLDRAMRSIAELGYNRVDLMTYRTQRHHRFFTWREPIAEWDPRLPAEASVFSPSPRNQMINACLREGMQFSDVWLSYNDFHLPRYIEPYIRASERWIAREMQDMRFAPSFDGIMLYDEMYETAVSGLVEAHQNIFGRIRAAAAEAALGQPPSRIEAAFDRYLRRPPGQRDPEAMLAMIRYRDWQQKGWADYVDRVVETARRLKPDARFGTFKRTWAVPGHNDGLQHGWPADLFRNLDIISHVHYADNITGWVNVPFMARILRTGAGKALYVNQPLTHEYRARFDGQYTRMMAFALMGHGANGISQYGLPQRFIDAPNPAMLQGRETVRRLNESVLLPFGELVNRTREGYRRVGIVSTLNQHALSEFNAVPVANQVEGIWIACHRLGFTPVFLREEHAIEPFSGFHVIFAPGVRFEGQLDPAVERRLREALAAGTRVVVEQGSALDLPGLTRLDDQRFDAVFLGNYFPTWLDDELNKVYEKSQPIVDYLAPLFDEWNVEPAARGAFSQGPCWRDGGALQYLIMANFDDPDYGHAVRQIMARPRLTDLRVAAERGRAAYDLLSQTRIDLRPAGVVDGREETELTLDMRRIQGALVAFAPEPVAHLNVAVSVSRNPARVRLDGRLVGESGSPIDGVFPTQVRIRRGDWESTFFRVMGPGCAVELDLPRTPLAGTVSIEVREALSGRTVRWETPVAAAESGFAAIPPEQPLVPYPREVAAFLAELREVAIAPSPLIPGADAVAEELAAALRERGVSVRIASERDLYRIPGPDHSLEDPFMYGYHSWRGGQEPIGPPAIVDTPLILLGGRNSLVLLDLLAEYAALTFRPVGAPGLSVRPSVQVVAKAFNIEHDTLCLVANDAAGLRHAMASLWLPPAEPSAADAVFDAPVTLSSAESTSIETAAEVLDTNEKVVDAQFDEAGNLYTITWGHGNNLFSHTPDGQRRFTRHLPEMGANKLQVARDRILAHTAAGARVYQLTLDGRPISQARLNLDPGSQAWCDTYDLARTDFWFHSQTGRLFHNLGDRMRVFDDEYRIVAEWEGTPFEDRDVTDEIMRRKLLGFAFSPDLTRIAQIEASWYFTRDGYKDVEVFDMHLVVRDIDGKRLFAFDNLLNSSETSGVHVFWPDYTRGPVVQVENEWLLFDSDLNMLERRLLPESAYTLDGAFRRLIRDGRDLVYFDGIATAVSRLGPFDVMPTVVALSPDGARLALLDEYGRVFVHRAADGVREHAFTLPYPGAVMRFTPDSQGLAIGATRSRIMVIALDGTLRWKDHLADANEWIAGPIPLYDPLFPDKTEKIWPVTRDRPGDLDAVVRMSENHLLDKPAQEGDGGGWHGFSGWGEQGPSARQTLLVGGNDIAQTVTGFIGDHSTWVLEFSYRSANGAPVELLAGLRTESRHPNSVARRFAADGDWRFGRVVIKAGAAPESVTAGFVASSDGGALVDGATLRRIRFPSFNHILHRPFHDVDVVILDNPLYAAAYDPFGALREDAPNRVVIPPIRTGALSLVESAYLQNGRLNDTSSQWYIQPFGADVQARVSLGFADPRWISMVALYFDAYDPENVTPHFDVLVENHETAAQEVVAQVRHNAQLMRLVTFPPVRTSLVTIRLVNSIARRRTLTEVEAYGPLSGRDEAPAFLDPEGQNTYMGDFTRVDRRIKRLAANYRPPIERRLGHGAGERIWCVPSGPALIDASGAHLPRAFGVNNGFRLDAPDNDLYWHRSQGPGYAEHSALFAGLLLRSGIDGKLHCIDPSSGRTLWSVPLGERLFGGPVAIGDDAFVANESGRLYRLDLADGSILGEAALSGGVRGAPATDGERLYFVTHEDGALHAYSVAGLKPLWRVEVARWTESTPAVYEGVVYMADANGTARAVEAATGSVLWTRDLGQEFIRCPVVTPETVREAYRRERAAEMEAYELVVAARRDAVAARERAETEAAAARDARAAADAEIVAAQHDVEAARTEAAATEAARAEAADRNTAAQQSVAEAEADVARLPEARAAAEASARTLSEAADRLNEAQQRLSAAEGRVVAAAQALERATARVADTEQALVDASAAEKQAPVPGERPSLPPELPRALLFGCRGGRLTALDRANGNVLWSIDANTRFRYEPVILGDRVLFEDNGLAKLATLSDGKVSELIWSGRVRNNDETQTWQVDSPQFSFSYYRGHLIVVPRDEHDSLQRNYAWHHIGGRFIVLAPDEPTQTGGSPSK